MAKAKGAGRVSGLGAVRLTLEEKGYDTPTQEIHDHIFKTHGLNIANNKISSYKSSLRKDAGYKPRGRKGHGGGRAATAANIGVDDIRAVKDLAIRFGADRLRALIDVLAR
jgi:hypothetical protein